MIKLLILFLSLIFLVPPGEFREAQKRFPRVRTAYSEKGQLAESLVRSGETFIFLQAFKEEGQLELWAGKGNHSLRLVKTFDFCALSGTLGPKRMQGDGQVPEGLYHIDRFNPNSSFYLSLGINYPNSSDRIRKTGNAGGDIFIHGSCVTIGCIPIEDEGIMELYTVAVEARDKGQNRIPVFIYPFRMDSEDKLTGEHANFWKELRPFYLKFKEEKVVPAFSIDSSGKYSG